ncbi:MAG: hypothetical protein ACE5G0_05755 [Rhodothermales bacterium]
MRVLRCTQRVLDDLGMKAGELTEPGAVEGVLKEWYVNLLRIERRKCLLFAEATTLYVFLVPGVVKKDLENLPALFTQQLRVNLRRDGTPETVVARVAGVEPFHLTKTRDRRVLGSMTDLTHHYRYHIASVGGLTASVGGLAHVDIQELNRRMNRTPMSMLGMAYSIDAVREQLME